MIVTIEVTKDDIETGERGECERCPIALALLRTLPQLRTVEVGDDTIDFYLKRGDKHTTPTPDRAKSFIEDFDDAWDPSPCSIDISIPEAVLTADRA